MRKGSSQSSPSNEYQHQHDNNEYQQHYGHRHYQQQQQQQQHQQYQQHYQYQQQQQKQYQQITTPQTVTQQLKGIYLQVIQKQRQQLNQLLNLQKLLNNLHSTTPTTRDNIKQQQQSKNNNNNCKQQQKKQFNLQRIGEKIDRLIEETDQVVVVGLGQQQQRGIEQIGDADVDCSGGNSKVNNVTVKNSTVTKTTINNINSSKRISIINANSKKPITTTNINTTKQLTYKLQPMPQSKKPPIPTMNRVSTQIGSNRVFNQTKYIPPRNRNQVTGKVTQTKIMTQEKVFRPEINQNIISGNSNSNSNRISTTTTTTMTKINQSVEKRQSKTTTTNNSAATTINYINTSQKNTTTQSNNNLQDMNSISDYKNHRMANNKSIKLNQFSKPIQLLYQQSLAKKKKQPITTYTYTQSSSIPSSSLSSISSLSSSVTTNNKTHHPLSLKQLLQKLHQQQMGHRNLQEKRRLQYIKKLNNFSLSLNVSNCNNQITNSIKKRSWKGYSGIFQVNQLLQKVQNDIQTLQKQCSQDLRSDPKQVYRLQCMVKCLQKQVKKIMSTTEIQVPQKIQLSFPPTVSKKQRKEQQKHLNKHSQSSSQSSLSLQPFYYKLSQLLKQTRQNQSLSTRDLSLLRVIVEIGLYQCKRSPLIVKSDDFDQWRDSYQAVE